MKKRLFISLLFLTISSFVLSSCQGAIPVSKNKMKVLLEPLKVSYEVGEMLNLNGIKIVDDKTEQEIYDYHVEPDEGYKFQKKDIGDFNLVFSKVNYENLTFTVKVNGEPAGDEDKTFTIYATNDIHGQVENQNSRASLGKTMTYLKDKGEQENTLLLDQGDIWQGSIYSNYNYGALITDVMNYVQYDAITVGNHDFDWGTQHLIDNHNRSYEGYKTPFLAANVYGFDFATKTVLDEQLSEIGDKTVTYTLDNGLKVGIVGVIGQQQITSIHSLYVRDITFKDHIQVIKEEAAKLRDEGCDVVIATAHTGEESVKYQGLENYVDLVLCGHTHQTENSMDNGLLFAQFGSYNQNLGHIELTYHASTGKVSYDKIEAISGRSIESTVQEVDPVIENLVNTYEAECDSVAKEVVASNVSGSFYSSEQLPNLMCEAMLDYATDSGYEVDLAFCNSARASLYSSSWEYADLYQAFPFDNKIFVFEASYHEMVNEVANYNNLCLSDNFDRVVEEGRTYKIAVIDFLLFHTNASRNYDYFDDNNGGFVADLDANYRLVLKNYLEKKGYKDGKALNAYDYSQGVDRFSKSFLSGV